MTTTATKNNTPPLPFPVRFYSPTSPTPDSQGRTLSSILAWPDSTLEYSHDYIQNLFPLPERSPINPSAPIIDEQTFTLFRTSPDLQSQLRKSLKRMLQFYGFELVVVVADTPSPSPTKPPITKTYKIHPSSPLKHPPFPSQKWLTPFNHNHLRITRIIRSCRILGLEPEARAFHAALLEIAHDSVIISPKTLMFWQRAAERPLFLAPEDDEGDGGRGKGWLRRFEEGREEEEVVGGE
ncbi:MAG: hypothetical protein L6R40_003200 [Gallowayella cf. fulva]|nr:MAG: hypothetical protein L6R40_003200 [Xanthomendoza cf. fulva]